MLETLNIKGRPRKRSKFNEIENEKVCHCQNRFDGQSKEEIEECGKNRMTVYIKHR